MFTPPYPYFIMGVKSRNKVKKELTIEDLKSKKEYHEGIIQFIDDEIESLGPKYPVGAIYRRMSTDCLYSLVDWNGVIRFLNITNNHFWKSKIELKSRNTVSFKSTNPHKAEYLTESEFKSVLGQTCQDFQFIAKDLPGLIDALLNPVKYMK